MKKQRSLYNTYVVSAVELVSAISISALRSNHFARVFSSALDGLIGYAGGSYQCFLLIWFGAGAEFFGFVTFDLDVDSIERFRSKNIIHSEMTRGDRNRLFFDYSSPACLFD